jgi:hypothetical protein
MRKTLISNQEYQFKPLKAHTMDEILKAGGTTAFAHKMGKTAKSMSEALSKLPPVHFTDDEWDKVLEDLKNDR